MDFGAWFSRRCRLSRTRFLHRMSPQTIFFAAIVRRSARSVTSMFRRAEKRVSIFPLKAVRRNLRRFFRTTFIRTSSLRAAKNTSRSPSRILSKRVFAPVMTTIKNRSLTIARSVTRRRPNFRNTRRSNRSGRNF